MSEQAEALHVKVVDVEEWRRVTTNPVLAVPDPDVAWGENGMFDGIGPDIADQDVVPHVAYTGGHPVGRAALRLVRTPSSRYKDGRFSITNLDLAISLARLAREVREERPDLFIPPTAVERWAVGESTGDEPAAALFAMVLVDPGYRERGVYGRLFDEEVEELNRRFPGQTVPIYLTVDETNERAIGIYEHRGFRAMRANEDDRAPLMTGPRNAYDYNNPSEGYPKVISGVRSLFMGALLLPSGVVVAPRN